MRVSNQVDAFGCLNLHPAERARELALLVPEFADDKCSVSLHNLARAKVAPQARSMTP
jgi:hypothetical protein